jgi:peptidyl-prolyl cis-trans isomerase SurA
MKYIIQLFCLIAIMAAKTKTNKKMACMLFLFILANTNLNAQINKKEVIDEVIAVVGNTPILRSELDILIAQIDPDIIITDKERCELFERLLTEKMLLHQANLDSLPLAEEEVDDKMDNNLRWEAG